MQLNSVLDEKTPAVGVHEAPKYFDGETEKLPNSKMDRAIVNYCPHATIPSQNTAHTPLSHTPIFK